MRYLALYLLFALLYVVRTHLFEREEVWRRERVTYDPVLRYDFLRAGLVLTLIVLALAWALPSAAAVPQLANTWDRLSEPWRTVGEEWQRLFSTLHRSPAMGIVEPFGSSLALGGPREVEDVLLMDIAAPHQGRYYWRGGVYAYYEGSRWEAADQEQVLLIPGRQPPGMTHDAFRLPVVQTVTNYVPGRRLLVGASQPVAVDREAEAYVSVAEDAPLELIRILGVSPLQADDQYAVTSHVSDVDATKLRQSGTGYPDWVRQRYLQLPPTLPDRVRLLAEEITVDADNPYDKAVAVEQYLRRNITYDLTPPRPPEGQDYVDFLLFDSQRDYCNGYATAMAVLARSLGIPARLAAGYGEGEYDAERGVYRVRETNAHSWPEVYFPSYGWVEFEPTVSERPLIRPEGAEEEAGGDQGPLGPGGEAFPEERGEMGRNLPELDESLEMLGTEPAAPRRSPLVWSLAVGFTLIAVVVGGWWAAENWGLHRLPAVEQAYARLLRFGRWLGRPLSVSDTPFEWVRQVSTVVPDAQEPMGRIVDLYVHARFARGTPADPQAKTAWKQARPALWRNWLRRLVPLSRLRSWAQRIVAFSQRYRWLRRLIPSPADD
jgi:transglutaminase-like putative cysteine protease